MTNERASESTEVEKGIRTYLRQALGNKIALHVNAAIDLVDIDPVEAECWAYEAGREAWGFDLQAPCKLTAYQILFAAFKRGFDSVEADFRDQQKADAIPVFDQYDM